MAALGATEKVTSKNATSNEKSSDFWYLAMAKRCVCVFVYVLSWTRSVLFRHLEECLAQQI